MTGKELAKWRARQGWTLEKAARFFGTTKTSVHRWEAGTKDKKGNAVKVPQVIVILTHLLSYKRNVQFLEKLWYKTLD